MFGETASFGDRFELPVDILGIALLTNSDTAYDYDVMLRVGSVNDAVVAELVLPVARQRAAQWQAVPFRVNSELFL